MGALLALLAAAANAMSSALQRSASLTVADERASGLRLFAALLRMPRWWLAIVAITLGFLLQALALSRASLTLVEPLLTFELPLTILFAALLLKGRVPARDWVSIAAVAVGLAALLAAASPHGGRADAVSGWRWALGGFAAAGLFGALLLGALRSDGRRRAALMGAAAGAGFGISAALIKVCAARVQHDPAALLGDWQPYAMVAIGVSSLALFNSAVHIASLVTVQPAVTLGDPLVSGLLGVMLFGEHIRLGALIAPELLGVALIVLGTLRLARSRHLPSSPPARDRAAAAPAAPRRHTIESITAEGER
ncbi:MAG: DMT family transporter [Solirubrobacteraceae bacterium]